MYILSKNKTTVTRVQVLIVGYGGYIVFNTSINSIQYSLTSCKFVSSWYDNTAYCVAYLPFYTLVMVQYFKQHPFDLYKLCTLRVKYLGSISRLGNF